jgi:hypothetical protein
VNLAGMDYEEADGRGKEAAASIGEVALARLNEAKLVLFVPVARHGSVYAEAAPKLKLTQLARSPDLYHIASLVEFHLLITELRLRGDRASVRLLRA